MCCKMRYLPVVAFFCYTAGAADVSLGMENFRIFNRAIENVLIASSLHSEDVKSVLLLDSAGGSFKNAPYAFAFYDSLNAPVTGNFSLADSALFVVDFRTNISGFYRILPGLWNALNAVIADSSYATMRTVFVPDTTGQQKASVIAFHYKGFIDADMENFTERPGFGKYRLYFPPGVNETTLRNELQAAGVQFAQ